jgi:hypothetical protein
MISANDIKVPDQTLPTVDNSTLLSIKPVGVLNISYKTGISFTKNSYILKSTATTIKNEIISINNNLKTFLAGFITNDEAKKYTTQDRYNKFMESALTQSILDSKLASYAKTEDVDRMKAMVLQKADALAGEATDFGAAAMVGINQGAAAMAGAVAPAEGEGE